MISRASKWLRNVTIIAGTAVVLAAWPCAVLADDMANMPGMNNDQAAAAQPPAQPEIANTPARPATTVPNHATHSNSNASRPQAHATNVTHSGGMSTNPAATAGGMNMNMNKSAPVLSAQARPGGGQLPRTGPPNLLAIVMLGISALLGGCSLYSNASRRMTVEH